MKVCEDCGERVYAFGCVSCHESDYIEVEFAEELAVIWSAEDARKDMAGIHGARAAWRIGSGSGSGSRRTGHIEQRRQ